MPGPAITGRPVESCGLELAEGNTLLSRGLRIHGKLVLITGASEGIGFACARVFVGCGAGLSLTARSGGKLLRAGGPDSLITNGDITNEGVRRAVVERTVERFGSIDVLINNAGVGMYELGPRAPMPVVRRIFEINLFAALEMAQLVVPYMKRQQSGVIYRRRTRPV